MSLRIGKGPVDMEESEKNDTTAFDGGVVDFRKGEQHLQELEVDIGIILLEEGEFNFESDQSPFPEGLFSHLHSQSDCRYVTDYCSACRDTQC